MEIELNITSDTVTTNQVDQGISMEELKASKAPTTPDEVVVSKSNEMEVVGKIHSAAFGGFTKILSFLGQGTTSQDIIYIKEGKLNLVRNAGYIYCDLSIMFEDNNLEILDPNKSIKLLSLIKGGDEVLFLKDNDNSRYLVSSLVDDKVSTTISLPQPDRNVTIDISAPEIGELQIRRELEIDVVDSIQSATKALESQYMKLEFQEEDFELVSISTSDDIFKQDLIHTKKPTKIFKIFNMVPVKPDEFYFEVYKNNDEIWIKTVSSVGMVSIEYMEKIQEESDFDTFSL